MFATTASETINLNVGDIVYVMGGGAVNGTYTVGLLTKVVARDESSGSISIADALPWALPISPGTVPNIQDLTTNGVGLEDVSLVGLTVSTPNIPFSFDAVYGFQAKDLVIPATPTFNQQLFWGGFASNIVFDSCAIAMGRLELPTYSYITFTNNFFTVPLVHATEMYIDGGTAGVNISRNAFFGIGIGICTSITGLNVTDNEVNYILPIPPLTFGIGPLAFIGDNISGQDWFISQNTFITNARPIASAKIASIDNVVISDNTWRIRGAVSSVTNFPIGSTVTGNHISPLGILVTASSPVPRSGVMESARSIMQNP